MPKKKRNGPGARAAGQSGESNNDSFYPGSNGSAETHGVWQSTMSDLSSQSKDELVKSMQEMFSHLDPVVIYIVLSEADFKVENAMDALLELSGAAEGKITPSVPVSGFEMAASVLEPFQSHTDAPATTSDKSSGSHSQESQEELSPDTTHLTEEFDSLIDQELKTLLMPQASLPLAQSTPADQETLRELDQADAGNDTTLGVSSVHGSYSIGTQECASPLNELSLGGVFLSQDSKVSVDFSHLTNYSSCAPSRSSVFNAYQKPEQFSSHVPEVQYFEGASLNIQGMDFQSQRDYPVFITPVVQVPNPWTASPATRTLAFGPVSHGPLKPSTTIPKLFPRNLRLEGQVLVLLRGAPGSGKSTLASAMLEQNPYGIVLSTDEYFTQNGKYHFKPDLLGEAHAWNHRRANDAFKKGLNPIIIDNTNMQCWEMKPYVAMALKYKYKVLFREPNTWWKTKPRELEKRTKHGVTQEKIRRILENQDRYVTVQSIMASRPRSPAIYGVDVSWCDSTLQRFPSHPDLVGDSGCSKLNDNLSSSLLDVSSFNPSLPEKDTAEGTLGAQSASLDNVAEQSEAPQSDTQDGADLDRELEARVSLSGNNECHINETHDLLESCFVEQHLPLSIGQRVRREQEHSKHAEGDASMHPLSFEVSDGSLGKTGPLNDLKKYCSSIAIRLSPEQLDFVGDWPTESLEQRRPRSCEFSSPTVRNPARETSAVAVNITKPDNRPETEFLKLLDLLQCGSNQVTQETTQDSGLTGRDGQYSSLVTEGQTALPDCVLDWSSVAFSDTANNSSCTRNLPQELKAVQEEYSESATKVENIDMPIQLSNVTALEMSLEENDKPAFTPYTCVVGSEVCNARKKGPPRRAGKICKLATTFSHQGLPLIHPRAESPVNSEQLPDQTTTLEHPLTTYPSALSQTDPQDFALLWRINKQKCSDPESGSSTRKMVILKGNPLNFSPKLSSGISPEQQVIPYRVCHDKGSQVEEDDLRESPFKQQSLETLSYHFQHVPLETLEDLYEKCHHDMEWITNLLLDSGECLHRGDEDGSDAEHDETSQADKKEPLFETLDRVKDQTGSEWCTGQSIDSNNDCSSTVSIVDKEPQDSRELKPLEYQPRVPQQGEMVEALEDMPGPSSVTHPLQPWVETTTLKGLPISHSKESENQRTPLQEVPIVSQSEVVEEDLDKGLVWHIPNEVEQESETNEEINAITESLLAQLELMEHKKAEERKKREKERRGQTKSGPMNIQTLELKLTTELALQLTELFGPVGISPGEFTSEDCSVLMDLNLARLLHQKWKETIQERQRQTALSYHLLQESSVYWGDSQPGLEEQMDTAHFLIGEGYSSLSSQSEVLEGLKFMDHWNVSHPRVSFRDIMIEEQVMQDSLDKSKLNYWDTDKKDGAAILKEKQLFSHFPTIDRHFLSDIFRDYNYSLEQTLQFLHTLLDDGPVRNVVAPEIGPENYLNRRAPSKERKQRNENVEAVQFQDTEDPEYEDFRTEAILQRQRQRECLDKAAEAYRQGRKDVAGFYAQQGRLHGQKMKEANHRSAMQIFERVNATLLPQNVLDLHGLHVEEALRHLQQVLINKTAEWQQGLCRPQLSVITGRGNRSHGGVARIKPAVLEYLRNHQYRYTEINPGLVIVTFH